jgi:ESCRT-II complex subunit VPS36
MKQAGEMVALAKSFNRSLMEHEAQRQALPEDAQFIIGSSMARLGLVGPTPAAATSENGKEEKWLADLTKELATVLTGNDGNGGLMKARGMIALDEVWGAWNRARGVGQCFFILKQGFIV